MRARGIVIATAAAALFVAGGAGTAVAGHHEGDEEKIKCHGVNECKGQADCKTTQNACKGQAACKGHGFKAMKAADCLSTGGVIGDIS